MISSSVTHKLRLKRSTTKEPLMSKTKKETSGMENKVSKAKNSVPKKVHSLLGEQGAIEIEILERERDKRRFAARERIETLANLNTEGLPLLDPRLRGLEKFVLEINRNKRKEEPDHAVPVQPGLCRT
jgi:hypothetical protein